jgi:hypothetical protein
MKRGRCFAFFALLIVGETCLPMGSTFCQSAEFQPQSPQIKRLILTDGSFERITRYSIQGDRVRYFSSERSAWEELPNSLVDWAATEKYARESASESADRVTVERAKDAKEKEETEARFPVVAPGLRLPLSDEVLMLDFYQGESQLIVLDQNESDLNKNTRSNILRGVINPISSSKQTVELAGPKARIQAHIQSPAIYIPVKPADSQSGFGAESAKDRFRIARCENRKGNRVVAAYSVAVYGKVKQEAQYIDVVVEPLSTYWARIVPASPLPPGEYALVELDEKGTMNMFVRDFGVDSTAPPNPAVGVGNSDRGEPVLLQKPHTKPKP